MIDEDVMIATNILCFISQKAQQQTSVTKSWQEFARIP
jgi:hypothetical protein